MVTTEEIKQLRDRTGVSVMKCKKALEEAGGDVEKALIILRKEASASADKKSDRDLGAGAIASYVHGDGVVGTLVELSCETDFVSKNEDFQKLAYEIAMHVAATNPAWLSKDDIGDDARQKAKEVFAEEIKDKPADLQEKILSGKLETYFDEKTLLEQSYIKDESKKIKDLVNEAVQKFGERTEIRRFARFSVKE
jgi:elongation factor Ts